MTNTDPIVAEIDLSNPPGNHGLMSVHLSDAPKVAGLLETCKALAAYHKEVMGQNPPPSKSAFTFLIEKRLVADIRAIEPEWSP